MADPLYIAIPPFFNTLQVRDGGMNRCESYTRQRHEPAHMKNAVQEAKEIRILGHSDNTPHDFRDAFPGNSPKPSAAYYNINTGLDAYATRFNANACLFQGKIRKREGLRAKRSGKVNTASGCELHLNNLFFE